MLFTLLGRVVVVLGLVMSVLMIAMGYLAMTGELTQLADTDGNPVHLVTAKYMDIGVRNLFFSVFLGVFCDISRSVAKRD